MKNLNRYIVILIFIALIHVISWGATTAAVGSTSQEAFGERISVTYHTGDLESEVHGELIAIHSNQILILTAQGLTSISTDSISRMQLARNSYRRMIYPAKPLSEFLPYARFPQGLPKVVDRQSMNLSVQWEAVIAAEQDANTKFNRVNWFMVGFCGGLFYGCGPILTYRHEPGLPSDLVATRFIGKSPEYTLAYTVAYKKKTKSLRLNSTLSGFALLSGCAGGCGFTAMAFDN
ncbi:MAG: hypothetical protein OXL96_21290 [Candidatus Poribacteria bacterium]|nr:hypothetical protein [Candidatus Poribacteria bacterium]